MHRALPLLIAAMLVAGCGSDAPESAAVPSTVSVAEAATLREEGAFVLDVREPGEWVEGHIPDATLIPLGSLEARSDEVPRDQTIVVVCRSGNRSAEGRDILIAAGFPEVTSLDGGMDDWARQGQPIETGD